MLIIPKLCLYSKLTPKLEMQISKFILSISNWIHNKGPKISMTRAPEQAALRQTCSFFSLSHSGCVALPSSRMLRRKPLGHHQLLWFLSLPIYKPLGNPVRSNFKMYSRCEPPPPTLICWDEGSLTRTWIFMIALYFLSLLLFSLPSWALL